MPRHFCSIPYKFDAEFYLFGVKKLTLEYKE
jgi:hypothetical protein